MICDKKNCTGCSACFNICPKNAITMKEDEYGNIYPTIDSEKCVNCGLCKKVCPQLNNDVFIKSKKAYAMHSIDASLRSQSSSGGAATLFYKSILKQGGIVYGASNLFGTDSFSFIKICNIEDLYKVKGSKYVHCYINETYKEIKKELISKKKVLFIGTPCQVAGLKKYLMKDYGNLICVDIICHGVPSQKLLFDEISRLGIDKKKVKNVCFRDDKRFNFKIYDLNDNLIVDKPSNEIYYYNNFLEGNIYRENCYNCKYARRERISDVTIGDFWGLNKNSIVYDDEMKGISLIIQNTEKGAELIKSIENESIIEERNLEEAYKENGQLNRPMTKNRKYDIYKKNYPLIGYEKTMQKMVSKKDKIKKIIKNKSLLYRLLKNNK